MKQKDFENHNVFGLLDQINQKLRHLSDSVTDKEIYHDIEAKHQYLVWLLETSDVALISLDDLNFVQSHLQNILSHIPDNGPNFSQYDSISNWFSAIFARFPYPRLKRIFRSEVNEKISELTGAIDNFMETISVKQKRSFEEVIELERRVSQIKGEIDQTARDLSKLKWSGKFRPRAKMYPALTTGYGNDEKTQFFGQV